MRYSGHLTPGWSLAGSAHWTCGSDGTTTRLPLIAGHLNGRPEVRRVHYPGLETHAAHDVADRQMSGFGGVLSVELVGGLDGAARFVEHLELFQLSASLGSVESLVVHPASMWKAMLTEQQLADAGLDPGLVRLACGQEDVADLIEDMDNALDSLHMAVG